MTLYQRLLVQIGEDICAGRYRPGDVIPVEPLLCEQYGVSRVVVREAIKGLAAKGMVATRRKTGTVVLDVSRWNLFDPDVMAWRVRMTGVDPKFAADLAELRRIVEPAAGRLAAQHASAAQRKAIDDAYQAMARAVAGDGDYIAADLAFHREILDACDNQFVRQMQDAISVVLRTTFQVVTQVPGGAAASLPLHLALCKAIQDQDPDAAERAVHAVLEQAEADLRRQVSAKRRSAGKKLPKGKTGARA